MADGMERRGAAEDGGRDNEGGAEQAFEALRAEVAALRAALAQQVEALPDAALRRGADEWAQQAEQERAAKQEQAAQQARSSPGMRP